MKQTAKDRLRANPFVAYLIKYSGVICAILVMGLLLTICTDRFLTMSNVINVLRQISINAIIAFGMTFVILTGGIDLSVGSVVALSGTITAGMMLKGLNMYAAILVGLSLGLLTGLFNGFVISRTGMPPFVVTLCSMTVCSGCAYVYSNGKPIPISVDAFNFLGNGYVGKVPVPVLFILLCFVVCTVLLNKTKFGKYVYALGGNRDAARFSGINIRAVEVKVYVISGILASLSGIILAGRMYSGQPTAGEGYELDAIAAVVIGGTSMTGGIGAVGGTILGALVIGILSNGMNLLKAQYYAQTIAKGIVILLAVYIDLVRHQVKNNKQMKNVKALEKA